MLIFALFSAGLMQAMAACPEENIIFVQGNIPDAKSPTGSRAIANGTTKACLESNATLKPYDPAPIHLLDKDGQESKDTLYVNPASIRATAQHQAKLSMHGGRMVSCVEDITRTSAEITKPVIAEPEPATNPEAAQDGPLSQAVEQVRQHQAALGAQQQAIVQAAAKAVESPDQVMGFIQQSAQQLKQMNQTLTQAVGNTGSLLYQNQAIVHDSDIRSLNKATQSALTNIQQIQGGLTQALTDSKQFLSTSPVLSLGKSSLTSNEMVAIQKARSALLNTPLPAGTDPAQAQSLLQFAGLTKDQQQALQPKLPFAEQVKLKEAKAAPITILHSGYLLGNSMTGVDCSRWISSLISTNRLTTHDLRAIWLYLVEGKFPATPVYTPKQQSQLKRMASLLMPINVYTGDLPASGDLLVYRISQEQYGHVVMVKSFDFYSYLTWVLEAAQNAKGLQEREFPLSMDPPAAEERFIRPGLYVLRPKPDALQKMEFETELAQN